MSGWKRLSLWFGVILSVLLGFSVAHAFTRHVTFCNKDRGAVEVAWGYEMTGTTETRSQGWKAVQSCGCTTLFKQDVRTTEFFFYVTRKGSAVEDAFMTGTAPLCVRAKEFTHRASNVNQAACAKSGGKWVKFQMADATKEHFTVNFGSGGKCVD